MPEGASGVGKLLGSSRPPGACRATSARRPPARFTRAASSGTCCARLRRRVRQPGARRGRGRGGWRSRDRSSRGLLEGRCAFLIRSRRRGAADTASERLQDLRTHGPRASDERTRSAALFAGHGYEAVFVEGVRPEARAPAPWRTTLESSFDRIARRADGWREAARSAGPRAFWPLIVLRTPKGWTGPKELDGVPIEGHLSRAPGAAQNVREQHAPTRDARSAGCAATGPKSCSTRAGAPSNASTRWLRKGERRMGANPHANGGRLTVPLSLPDFTPMRVDRPTARRREAGVDAPSRAPSYATSTRRTRRTSAWCARTRPTPTASAPSSRSRTAALAEPTIPERRSRLAARARHGGA